jgi:hypothetical protein
MGSKALVSALFVRPHESAEPDDVSGQNRSEPALKDRLRPLFLAVAGHANALHLSQMPKMASVV